jgi:hypothetical protein
MSEVRVLPPQPIKNGDRNPVVKTDPTPVDALYLGTMSLGRNIEMQDKGTIQKAFSTRAFTLYLKAIIISVVIYNTYLGYPQVIHRLWKSVYGALPNGNVGLAQLTLR